jgi:hypothetical protein
VPSARSSCAKQGHRRRLSTSRLRYPPRDTLNHTRIRAPAPQLLPRFPPCAFIKSSQTRQVRTPAPKRLQHPAPSPLPPPTSSPPNGSLKAFSARRARESMPLVFALFAAARVRAFSPLSRPQMA